MINRKYILLFALIGLGWGSIMAKPSCAGEDFRFYFQAQKYARQDEIDFSFMACQKILTEHPDSRYAQECLFGVAEYYYDLPNLTKAKDRFEKYVGRYPETEAKLFALAYLYKISVHEQNEDAAEKYKNQIVNYQRVSLVFREKETLEYKSILNKRHEVCFYIDRIEFYVEGEILTYISY